MIIMTILSLQKSRRRTEHARKETDFLRLKRTRLGLEDFDSLKVIGRGAFGEVKPTFMSTEFWIMINASSAFSIWISIDKEDILSVTCASTSRSVKVAEAT